MVEIPLQSPVKLSIFLILSLFFHLSLPKIWQAHPIKTLFSKLARIDVEAQNCGLRKHLKMGDFYYIFTIIGKKGLGG